MRTMCVQGRSQTAHSTEKYVYFCVENVRFLFANSTKVYSEFLYICPCF